MAFMDPVKRSKMYVMLAVFTFFILILSLVAISTSFWSVDKGTSMGLWSTCVRSELEWEPFTCTSHTKVMVCDGAYQGARVLAVLTVSFLFLFLLVVVANAMCDSTLVGPMVVFAILAWLCMLISWVCWMIYRGGDCTSTDGADLGYGFILWVFAWCLLFFALVWSLYMATVKIGQQMVIVEEEIPAYTQPTYYANAPVY